MVSGRHSKLTRHATCRKTNHKEKKMNKSESIQRAKCEVHPELGRRRWGNLWKFGAILVYAVSFGLAKATVWNPVTNKQIHTNAGITESVDKDIKTLQVCPTWKSETKGCWGETEEIKRMEITFHIKTPVGDLNHRLDTLEGETDKRKRSEK